MCDTKKIFVFQLLFCGLNNKGKIFWHFYVHKIGTELLKSIAKQSGHNEYYWRVTKIEETKMLPEWIAILLMCIAKTYKNFKPPYKHSNL